MDSWSESRSISLPLHQSNNPIIHQSNLLRGLLLRIDQDPVVDEDDEIVFAITGHVRDSSFAWFGQITAAAAESAFLEDLPAIGGH